MDNEYYVYILFSESKGVFYKGLTNSLDRRLLEHNTGKCQATKNFIPLKLVFAQVCSSRFEARMLEKYFKSGSGREIIIDII